MASKTRATELRRANKVKRGARKRKAKESRRSTPSAKELFGD
ncbi:MAG: hypothetical protein AB7F59_05950 [Bdellovibrionales bacterium]